MVTSSNAPFIKPRGDVPHIDESRLEYVRDAAGTVKSVVVPIDLWKDISSQIETDYLLSNPVMRERLDSATRSTERIPLDDVLRRAGFSRKEWEAASAEADE